MNIVKSGMTVLGVAAAAVFAMKPALAQEAMPEKLDIPADYSTVICPDEAGARTLISDYYRLNERGLFDIYRFFDGLKVTGCDQSHGPVVITEVLVRKQVGVNHHILYRGKALTDKMIFGLVDEEGNNQVPRNDFDRWLQTYSAAGYLNLPSRPSPRQKLTYVCASPQAAQNAISAIPKTRHPGVLDRHQIKAKIAAFHRNGCTVAEGRFRITAVHGSTFISLGYEAGETWTALSAVNDKGQVVGLLHDDDLTLDIN